MTDIKSLMPIVPNTLLDQKIDKLGKSSSSTAPKTLAQTEKAATDFEALLLKQMLDEMWKTIPDNSLMGGGSEEKQFRGMYTEALAQDIAEKQSIGVKQVLIKDFERAQKLGNQNKE